MNAREKKKQEQGVRSRRRRQIRSRKAISGMLRALCIKNMDDESMPDGSIKVKNCCTVSDTGKLCGPFCLSGYLRSRKNQPEKLFAVAGHR